MSNEPRTSNLVIALRDLSRAYVRLLESGRDRIIALGGDCDPVDTMERGDPYLAQARVAIREVEDRAPSEPFARRRPTLDQSNAWASAEEERDWWRDYALEIEERASVPPSARAATVPGNEPVYLPKVSDELYEQFVGENLLDDDAQWTQAAVDLACIFKAQVLEWLKNRAPEPAAADFEVGEKVKLRGGWDVREIISKSISYRVTARNTNGYIDLPAKDLVRAAETKADAL